MSDPTVRRMCKRDGAGEPLAASQCRGPSPRGLGLWHALPVQPGLSQSGKNFFPIKEYFLQVGVTQLFGESQPHPGCQSLLPAPQRLMGTCFLLSSDNSQSPIVAQELTSLYMEPWVGGAIAFWSQGTWKSSWFPACACPASSPR